MFSSTRDVLSRHVFASQARGADIPFTIGLRSSCQHPRLWPLKHTRRPRSRRADLQGRRQPHVSSAILWGFKDNASPQADAPLDLIIQQGTIVPAFWYTKIENGLGRTERRNRLSPTDVREAISSFTRTEAGPGRT
jgi:hypothetical protein